MFAFVSFQFVGNGGRDSRFFQVPSNDGEIRSLEAKISGMYR